MLFKHSFAFAFVLLAAFRNALAQQAECDSYGYGPDVMTQELGVDMPQVCFDNDKGQNRCYYTYVPPCAADSSSPVLMILHGSESCPVVNAKENGWIQKAQDECFVAVFPLGRVVEQSEYNLFMNCWEVPGGLNLPPATVPDGAETNSCCCSDGFEKIPDNLDLEFLYRVMLSVLDTTENIDTHRLYISGHSNGCILAHAFHRTYSSIVAAMSCTAGPAITPVPGDYSPTPQLSIRGMMDAIVAFDGKLENLFLEDTLYFPSAEASFQESLGANGCTGEIDPIVVAIPEMDIPGLSATMEHRKGEECTAETELVILNTAGHAIVNNGEEVDTGAATTTVDITSIMWDFLSRFESLETPVFAYAIGEENDPEQGESPTELAAPVEDSESSGSTVLFDTTTTLVVSLIGVMLSPFLS